MIVILRRISTRFALGFLSVLFLCNSLYGQCDDGYLEIDEDCYWEKDIYFLQSFIDGSEDFLDVDMDDNDDGMISPLELGVQTWNGKGRLTSLFCSNRGLTGEIPESIINLDKLYWLLLSDNQITGTIPEKIGNLANLIKLDLQWNEIEGSIPRSIEKLRMLQHLDLSFNQLTGSIPEGIGNLTNLKKLLLSDNQLTGSIPDGIENLTGLKKLLLNDNQLGGTIPNSLCELDLDWDVVSRVNLTNNNLCPQYPVCVELVMGDQDTSACVDLSDIQTILPISEAKAIPLSEIESSEIIDSLLVQSKVPVEVEAKETEETQTTAPAVEVAVEKARNKAERAVAAAATALEEVEEVADDAEKAREAAEQAAIEAVLAAEQAREVADEAIKARIAAEQAVAAAKAVAAKARQEPQPKLKTKGITADEAVTQEVAHQEKIDELESNTSRLSNTEIDQLVEDGLLTAEQGKKEKKYRNSKGTEVAEVIKRNQTAQQVIGEAAEEAREEAEQAIAAAEAIEEEAEQAAQAAEMAAET